MTRPAHIVEPDHVNADPAEINLKVLLPEAMSGGAVNLFEEITPPLMDPPLHVHYNEDELYSCLRASIGSRQVS